MKQPGLDLLIQSSIHDVDKLFDSLQQMEAALHQTPHKKLCLGGTNHPVFTLVKDVIHDVHSSKNKRNSPFLYLTHSLTY